MNNKSYSVISLILNHFVGFFFGLFAKRIIVKAPLHISAYSFVKVIQHEKGQDTIVALYKDKSGNKAVAKIWFGNYKNYSYYSLKNEYLAYVSLHKIISRTKNIIPGKFANVKIPDLLLYQESHNSLSILVEWVEGEVASNLSDKNLLVTYALVSSYLDFLTKHAKASELESISQRSGLHYLFLYPMTLVIALIKHPEYAADLLRGLVKVVTKIPRFLKSSKLSLVHRDLNFENILVNKDTIYLIDFQFLALTYKASEFVNTLRYCWDKNRLIAEVNELMIVDYIDDYSARNLFQPLSIIHATHGLIGSNFSKSIIIKIAKFLKASL